MTPDAHPEGTPENAAPSVISGYASRKRSVADTGSSGSSDGDDELMYLRWHRMLELEQLHNRDQAQEASARPVVVAEVLCNQNATILHKERRTRSLAEALLLSSGKERLWSATSSSRAERCARRRQLAMHSSVTCRMSSKSI